MESVNGDETKDNFSPSAPEEIKECLSRCPDCIINTVAPGRTLTYILYTAVGVYYYQYSNVIAFGVPRDGKYIGDIFGLTGILM